MSAIGYAALARSNFAVISVVGLARPASHCLGQKERMELCGLLRGGASDAEFESAMRDAVELKPERHEFGERPGQIIRFMSATGG